MSGQPYRHPGSPHHTGRLKLQQVSLALVMDYLFHCSSKSLLSLCLSGTGSRNVPGLSACDLLLLPLAVPNRDPTAIDGGRSALSPVERDHLGKQWLRLPALDLAEDGLILRVIRVHRDHRTGHLASEPFKQANIAGKLGLKLRMS